MADYTHVPEGARETFDQSDYAAGGTHAAARLTQIAGAAVSLALVVGVGVWGYKLLVRDVTGIPVVRAVTGEMRVRPEDPGGQLAQNQGLSVNTVAVAGAPETPIQQVRLAPRPVDLTEDDQPMPQIAEAEEAPAAAAQPPAPIEVSAPLSDAETIDALVAELTSGVTPLEALDEEQVPVLAAAQGGADLAVSLRPALRPLTRAATPVSAAAAAAGAAVVSALSEVEVDPASLPAGTRLVQLGAFDTAEIARTQWGQLSARFAPFMADKKRVVMEAKSGGRTFYRLRAHGFEDIGDARRFCSALVAENVDCIPVVSR